ncbi:M35 family metallo-endopeptidase [Delftia sp. PS-11]|uniref:M35 family metallo-endopeptidase n=1 Tax=Delftia sp. PS-11 TaxID=2767222 RepID=UPI002454E990|nr:M35 family metallo-endopeptidase [Delftia sp. PS-11]KAJ8745688.1 hypothetical protein H9T68_05535 [Delftia sp. PS-11]
MTIFIKPGPATETARGEEHGFGHSRCLAQAPQYPFDVELWHYGNFKSSEIFPLENHHTPRISPGNKGEIQQLKIGNSTHNFVDPPDRLEDRICPNMTNEQFIEEFNEIRDKLVKILENRVIPSVNQWSPQIREKAIKWFGTDSEKLKLILQNGYPKCVSVLKQLSGENFLKPSTGNFFGCEPNTNNKGVHAAVCPTDGGHHIAIYPGYCESRTYSSTQSSKIGTILHEVCHFQTTFTSLDHAYDQILSERLAQSDPSKAINNTDSFVMFALHGVVYGSM